MEENKEGLCRVLKKGDKHTVRVGLGGVEVGGQNSEVVEISGFDETGVVVAHCDHRGARLVKFRDNPSKGFHPMWIVDCRGKCPFYNSADLCRPSAEKLSFKKVKEFTTETFDK